MDRVSQVSVDTLSAGYGDMPQCMCKVFYSASYGDILQ